MLSYCIDCVENIFAFEQERRILKTTENLGSHNSTSSKIDIIRKMLNKLSTLCKRFRNTYDDNTKLQRHIHKSCVNNMVIYINLNFYIDTVHFYNQDIYFDK